MAIDCELFSRISSLLSYASGAAVQGIQTRLPQDFPAIAGKPLLNQQRLSPAA